MKNDLLMCSVIAEAIDECGIYDDEKLKEQLQDYAYRLRGEERFAEIDETNYEEFLFALLYKNCNG